MPLLSQTAQHRHATPDGNGYQRETRLVRMRLNPDGSIQPMAPMTAPFQPDEPLVNSRGRP